VIAVIDYKTANIGSMMNMLAKVGVAARVAIKPQDLRGASRLILPGIGHFDTCARNLRELGFAEPIAQMVLEQRIPILGICVGAQLLTRGSEEGMESGLGFLNAEVKRFESSPQYKIPHMGWNHVQPTHAHSLFLDEGGKTASDWRFYFVHSYYMNCDDSSVVLATSHHGRDFACAIGREHIAGLQFHPEKSHRFGLALLRNFAKFGISAMQES
jgi:glutamine amidotransferase